MNSPGVVLLDPYLSSSTNVPYTATGYFWKSARHTSGCTECEGLCDLWMRVNTVSMNKRFYGYLVFG